MKFSLLAASLACAAVAFADTYYASPNGSGDADCSSADNAGSLPNAFARATADGDEVVLLSGTYDFSQWTPTTTGNDGYYFTSAKAIVIRSETGNREDVTLDGKKAAAARAFKLTGAATVQDLTFVNFGTLAGPQKGGAAYLSSASAKVTNCLFRENYGKNEGGALYTAGRVDDTDFIRNGLGAYDKVAGLYFGDSGAATSGGGEYHGCLFADNCYTNYNSQMGGTTCYGGSYYDCVFSNNVMGAGHTAKGGTCWNPSVVSNCCFYGNRPNGVGGAVRGDGATVCYDSVFVKNVAKGGGALYNCTAYHCFFTNNLADVGYGVNNEYLCGGAGAKVHAFDCDFYGNVSTNMTSPCCGGGALTLGSATRCTFRNHYAWAYFGGGGVAYGTALTNCLVAGNSMGRRSGDGLNKYSGGLLDNCKVVNCTVVSNAVSTSPSCVIFGVNLSTSYGEAYTGSCEVVNSIAAGNVAGALTVNASFSNSVVTALAATAKDLGGNSIVTTPEEVGFVSTDVTHPYFAYLRKRSMAIDAGGDVGFTADDLDLKHEKRLNGTAVDQGCYEFWTDLSGDWCEIAGLETGLCPWTGAGTCVPTVTLTDFTTEEPLAEGTDYRLEFADNDRIGTATMTVVGLGKYAGKTQVVTYKVVSAYGDGVLYFAAADVTDEQDETRDCLTVATAGTLKKALGLATKDGDAVVLLAGTYDFARWTPTSLTYFAPTKKITIVSQTDDKASVTLKGDPATEGRAFSLPAGVALRGVTLRGFHVETSGKSGGAVAADATTVISNCHFTANYALMSGGAVDKGICHDCTFYGNGLGKANVSGYGGAATQSSECHHCAFVDNVVTNYAHNSGGGACREGSLYDCVFTNNSISGVNTCSGGACFSPSIASNCWFVGNRSAYYAGAVRDGTYVECHFISNVGNRAATYLGTFRRCTFEGNVSTTYPGVLWESTLYDCMVVGNVATNNANQGMGGATLHNGRATRCVFRDNFGWAQYGGAGTAFNSTLTNCLLTGNVLAGRNVNTFITPGVVEGCDIVNCTIVGNRPAYGAAVAGSGTYSSKSNVVNCVIADNGTVPSVTKVAVSHTLYETEGTEVMDLGGNIVRAYSPRWFESVDPDDENAFKPRTRAPFRDKGAAVGMTADDTDLAGANRVNGIIDFGCYECWLPLPGLMLLVR